MSTDAVAILGFVVLFILMLLRVPVGMAMGLVGITGYSYINGLGPALKLVGQTSMRTVTDYTFGVIPMFMLMGALVSVSGVSRELFKAANSMIGHLRGGLGVATVLACGGFAAICGSSVATAATFSSVAYPEMRRFGYPQSFSTGVIAAGGTLGAMLPPSTVLAVYAILTQQDIGKLFMAGIIPGLLAMLMYVITIMIIVKVRPEWLARRGQEALGRTRGGPEERVGADRAVHLRDRRLYGGFFTPTEAGGVGASGAFILGLLRAQAEQAEHPRGAAVGHPDGGRRVHRADRRPAVRLFPHHHPEPAEAHRIPHRPGRGQVRRAWP
jgi:tripartite ATP-independent transporter DctM subunit